MNTGEILDNRYKIIRVLGEGGMGKVYMAEHLNLGTLWAVKEIRKKEGSLTWLSAEPNILRKISHPALPRIVDVLEDADSLYIIIDYMEGAPLDKKLAGEGPFPEETVAGWARQLCDVLSYLHSIRPNPIIYRDLKPSNIILDAGGRIKLIDFGTAREYKEDSGNDTVYIGTRGYAAPEQYGAGQTGPPADIYSLGVTMHQLLTGIAPNKPPYELKPVRQYNGSLSEGIENIINKCIKSDPAERYQSASELMADLDKLLPCAGLHGSCGPAPEDMPDGTGQAGRQREGLPHGFRKLVLTVWGGSEFGCEMAYLAARMTGLSVLVADLDLMNPTADIHFGIRKTYKGGNSGDAAAGSGLGAVMDSIGRNRLTAEALAGAAVKRKELPNLFILTGNYRLSDYEYFRDDALSELIDKAYRYFDITVLLVNTSIYDSYTVISLIKSDFNIAVVRADVAVIREFNNYLVFLDEMQQIPLHKTRFVAFEYMEGASMGKAELEEVTGSNFLGGISFSEKRCRYRNRKSLYARRMEKDIAEEYAAVLRKLNIMGKKTFAERVQEWKRGFRRTLAALYRNAFCRRGRRTEHAGGKYAS